MSATPTASTDQTSFVTITPPLLLSCHPLVGNTLYPYQNASTFRPMLTSWKENELQATPAYLRHSQKRMNIYRGQVSGHPFSPISLENKSHGGTIPSLVPRRDTFLHLGRRRSEFRCPLQLCIFQCVRTPFDQWPYYKDLLWDLFMVVFGLARANCNSHWLGVFGSMAICWLIKVEYWIYVNVVFKNKLK